MIDKRIADKRYTKTGLTNTGTHIDVFTEHFSKSPDSIINLSRKSHIECSRRKFFKLNFSASDSSCRQE